MRTPFNKFAQQIIETLLLFAAVIVVVLFIVSPRGPFRGAVKNVVDMVINQIGHD